MGFFDKVKKAFRSKKEDVEYQNDINDELTDESTFTESIEKDNGNFNDDGEIHLSDSKEIPANDEIDKPEPIESLENDDESLNDNEEIRSSDLEEIPANNQITDKSTPTEKIRNFKYLDDLIHSGAKEIVLDSDIVLSDGEEFKYEEGIKLDVDELVIEGNGKVIDACGKTRIFYCTGRNITIKNIILKNGFIKKNIGGAIHNYEGELTITKSTFTENTAQEGSGGAIYNNEGCLTIIGSTFTGNTAQEGSGGAIHNYEGELTIIDSTITNNKNSNGVFRLGGGAICTSGKCCITNSKLDNNMSISSDGAAICNSGKCRITDAIIINNVGYAVSNFVSHGGAICNHGECIISCSTIKNNTANRCGAIGNHGECSIIDSTLDNNEAESGGAIKNYADGKLTIRKSTLQKNTTQGCDGGGAILNYGKCSISDSTLKNNESQGSNGGGAIRNYEGYFEIFDCEFLTNKSINNIILNNDSLEIYNTIFKDNQSKFIVFNDGNGANLGIFYGEFSENNVEKSVLCNTGKSCSIEKTIFQNNISINTANIINKSELTLINTEIKDTGKSILNEKYMFIRNSVPEIENKICGEGTVETLENRIPQGESFDFGYLDEKIHQSKTKEIILEHDITFENYERDFYEGGIELDIDNLIIDGNGKTIDGSNKSRIFIITGTNITLKNIVFKNGHSHRHHNSLNNNGGAIKFSHDLNLTIINCEFLNNTSENNGGAIYNKCGECTITDSKLENNIAAGSGGAVYNWGVCSITDSMFGNNLAYGKKSNTYNGGGAVYNGGVCTVTDSILDNNKADWKGPELIVNSGGAIRNEGRCCITNSKLDNNYAFYYGGTVYNSGVCRITDSTLDNNEAQYGGAILNAGKLTIAESTINNNTVRNEGGAISNSDKCYIAYSILEGNSAAYGGAIFNSKECCINCCELVNNKAYSEDHLRDGGGAIYNTQNNTKNDSNGVCSITNSLLESNMTSSYGGAIYLENSIIYESNNCTFKDNNPDDVYELK